MKERLIGWQESIGIVSLILLVMSCKNFIPDGAGFKEYAIYTVLGIAFFIIFYGGVPGKKKNPVKIPEIKLISGAVLQIVFLFVGRIEFITPFAMLFALASYSLTRAGSIGMRKNSDNEA